MGTNQKNEIQGTVLKTARKPWQNRPGNRSGQCSKTVQREFGKLYPNLPGYPGKTDQETVVGKVRKPSRDRPGNRTQICPEILAKQSRKP